MTMAYLAQPEQHQHLDWLGGATLSILLDGAASDGRLTVGRFDLSEGDASSYHMHTREDEVFVMIHGTASLRVGYEEKQLSAGGVAFLPRNLPHAYRIVSRTADMLMICTPAGIEGFFRTLGHDRATTRRTTSPPTTEQLAATAEQYGNIILDPPH
jgi:quercetin dioxygenase-like cupin family protein